MSKTPKPLYSAHGSHMIDSRLCVYHQGGLDSYCGFYAILNLVNFLKFKQSTESGDFIGAAEFEAFRRFIGSGGFRACFPASPFGDMGPDGPMLVEALSSTLLQFNLRGEPTIEEDRFLDPYDETYQDRFFRYGTEKPFASEKQVNEVLGLAVVKEDEFDDVGHWVVFVGKNHLTDTGITCENEWDGIVLDSDRGYERWRVGEDSDTSLPRISIRRDKDDTATPVEWIYSFVSLSL